MKTILVTGANGFVGTHTLQYLMKQPGIKLIAACRDKSRLHPAFEGEIRQGDIRDEAYLQQLFDGVDVVVNAIAWTSLWGNKQASEALFLSPVMKMIKLIGSSQVQQWVNISTTSAAAPEHSADAMSQGIPRAFWPHLNNVITIENTLRKLADKQKTVINMRLGLFAGENYALGLLPVLVPRMKTHLVPWVAGGKTEMPIIDGRDIGQAMGLAAVKEGLIGYHSVNVVGTEVPTVREVVEYIASEYALPKPHFSVPFAVAWPFAWLMEKLDPLLPWEPLIVRSIIHLLQNTGATNERATQLLGYQPQYHWRQAIIAQLREMQIRQKRAMKMARPIA